MRFDQIQRTQFAGELLTYKKVTVSPGGRSCGESGFERFLDTFFRLIQAMLNSEPVLALNKHPQFAFNSYIGSHELPRYGTGTYGIIFEGPEYGSLKIQRPTC